MINAKIILASAALFAAPASAQALEPVDALTGIIRMEVARQYCGLPLPEDALRELVGVVAPYIKKTPQEFTESVRRAAMEQGSIYQRNGSLPGFCANVGAIYGRYGK
ncbi:hypothetical protein V19_02 [Brucella phage V_19]|uniref:Uncharacterized protein n=30 Tax=Perisivirus TaxID=1984798 RepID=H2EI39_9CAUD|nr:hypothetical protein F354_gp02 [Brucella phage Tb]YP_007002068.1 hypothetical protein F355_gp02 [Brucella phage Pr]AHB81062.1 hypothetical protein Bk_02 [Brucella phage Bk]AHB81118.1 hypothetical protein Fz_02 [Brucella phage Fz]AHB81176.1 hypothetical protein R/C_02 [Brucella phage R/C]AHB81232.1 hypothetical protein S708OFR_02 [Brucella phage S708]AHB81346.1 hypothetical protein Wb_02 [Brucella phage Wb]AKO58990.1 hypothetical protein p0219_02 [Brucella phage 02_19]AKO59048.1 hypotheti